MKNKILQFAGTWKGGDLKECLAMVYATRGKFYLGDDMIDSEFNKFKEKLKEQKELSSVSCGHCWDYQQKLKEENENLKKLNEQLLGKPVGVTEWEQLVAENEKLKRDKETISHNANHFSNEIIKLEQEIEKLKAENEQLTGISGQLKVIPVDDEIKLNQIICPRIKELEAQLERTNKFYKELQYENAQLKAQLQNCDKCKDCGESIYCNDCMEDTLREATKRAGWGSNQNRDKASQVDRVELDTFNNHNMMPEHCGQIGAAERKPHLCPNCRGIGKNRAHDTFQTGYELFTGECFKDALGVAWKKCSSCKGTGIVWEGK